MGLNSMLHDQSAVVALAASTVLLLAVGSAVSRWWDRWLSFVYVDWPQLRVWDSAGVSLSPTGITPLSLTLH